MKTPQANTTPDVSPELHELIMSAVRIARAHSVRHVADLRVRLGEMHPEASPSLIHDALHFWAAQERRLTTA